MKKHILAFICVFVILFNTLSFKEAHAMDIGVAIDVGSDILYQGWDMINSILNGAIISFSPYTQYADKAAAMGAFYNDWGNILETLTGGTLNQDPAITFGDTTYPLDYGMSYNTMNYFVDEYGRIVDQSPADPYYFPMLISPETYAAWNRYQNSWIGNYIDAFKPDIPTVNPEPGYSNYFEEINGDGLNSFLSSATQMNISFGGVTRLTPKVWDKSISYYSIQGNFLQSNNVSAIHCFPLSGINIYSVGNGDYTFSYNFNLIFNFATGSGNFNGNGDYYTTYGRYSTISNQHTYSAGGVRDMPLSISGTYTGSLQQCFDYIKTKFKNVSVSVDGVLWTWAGQTSEPIALAPDVIRFGEDGPVLRNDVYIPDQDLYVDLIGWTNLVDDKILDGDTIGFDDLIDAGVLTDAEGNIITDENRDEYFKKRDIATVITDELVDADLDNLLPPAPSPPDDDPSNWHFPTIVIPDGGDPDPKHTGLSILARIVNVTNLSMPAEVMTMFWGICITLVILGIIKILHK